MLSGREIKPGFIVDIQRAQFKQNNQTYIPRVAQKVDKVQLKKLKKKEENMLSWTDDKGQGFKIVIIKNIFTA